MEEFTIKKALNNPWGKTSGENIYYKRFWEGKFYQSHCPDIFTEQPVSQILYNALIEQLRLYFIVGGMPEAIFKFTQTNSFTDVKKVHNDIVDSYLESLVKYHSRINRQSLKQILKIIPSQVGRQVKYTYLDNERRIEVIKRNLQILEKALLVHLIHSAIFSGIDCEDRIN